jgi:hypothetical protein
MKAISPGFLSAWEPWLSSIFSNRGHVMTGYPGFPAAHPNSSPLRDREYNIPPPRRKRFARARPITVYSVKDMVREANAVLSGESHSRESDCGRELAGEKNPDLASALIQRGA